MAQDNKNTYNPFLQGIGATSPYSSYLDTNVFKGPKKRKLFEVLPGEVDVSRGGRILQDIGGGIAKVAREIGPPEVSKVFYEKLLDLPFSAFSYLSEKPQSEEFLQAQRDKDQAQRDKDFASQIRPAGILGLQDEIETARKAVPVTPIDIDSIGVARPSFQSPTPIQDFKTIDKSVPGDMSVLQESVSQETEFTDKETIGGDPKSTNPEDLLNSSLVELYGPSKSLTGEDRTKAIEQYKQDFYTATGIDPSGKPDMKDAMVAFGLALMQNKAGKKLNIRKIFGEVGKAGEKAMPLLQKAKSEAKAAALSAGKYALEMRASDTAKAEAAAEKAMNRQDYYILPSDGSVSGTAASIMNSKGRKVKLNASELDALMKQKGFQKNYTVLAGSNFDSILKEVFSSKKAKDSFSTDKSTINLFNEKGVDGVFTFDVYNVNPNLDLNDPNTPKRGRIAGVDVNSVYKNLTNELDRIDKAEDQFADIIALVQGGAATTPEMVADSFISFGRKLGFGAPPDAANMTASDQIKFIVNKLSAQNAPEILGESGKTISDADRERVAQIVTEIKTIGGDDPSAVLAKMMDLKYYIVDKKRNDIYSAFEKFDSYSREDTSAIWGQKNQTDTGRFSTSPDLAKFTPEMEKRRLALRKKFGLS